MKISQLTTVQRDALTPSLTGSCVIYNTTTDKYQVFNENTLLWEDIATINYLDNNILQNGNSFGATMTIGTNDTQSLSLETNGVTKLTIDTNGKSTLSYLPDGTEMGISMKSTAAGTGSTGIEFISKDSLLANITNRLIASPDSFKFRNINTNRDWLVFSNVSSTFGNTSTGNYSMFLTCTTQSARLFTDSVRLFGIRGGASAVNQFTVRNTNVLGTDISNYETLVITDNDIPNRKFVTDLFALNIVQNGNSFAGAMTIGTNDNFALNLETNGITRATIGTSAVALSLVNPATNTNRVALSISNVTDDNNYMQFVGSTVTYLIALQSSRFLVKNSTTGLDMLSMAHATNELTIGSNAASTQSRIGLSNSSFPSSAIGVNSGRKFFFTDGGTVRLFVRTTNQIATDTTNYETLVTSDNDIPNRKFVTDSIAIRAIATISADTTLANQYTVLVDSTTATVTITLPAASTNNGRIYNIKKIVAANTVVVDGNGVETIDGNATITLTNQWETITIQSNGSNWFILSRIV